MCNLKDKFLLIKYSNILIKFSPIKMVKIRLYENKMK